MNIGPYWSYMTSVAIHSMVRKIFASSAAQRLWSAQASSARLRFQKRRGASLPAALQSDACASQGDLIWDHFLLLERRVLSRPFSRSFSILFHGRDGARPSIPVIHRIFFPSAAKRLWSAPATSLRGDGALNNEMRRGAIVPIPGSIFQNISSLWKFSHRRFPSLEIRP